MPLRRSLPFVALLLLGAALALPLSAQQAPNPVPPGSTTGGGLTRDALDAPAALPAPAATATARRTTSSRAHRRSGVRGTKRTGSYASISRHRRHRRHKARQSAVAYHAVAHKRADKPRAPLVSFIYWWNGWVMRTFHTRSGTVLLDRIGAKS